MLKKMILMLLNVSFIALAGCSNCCSGDDDLRTIPITNNPQVVPNTASPLPGMPSNNSPR